MAGLQFSWLTVPDAGLRRQLADEVAAAGLSGPNCLAGAAAAAAWNEGDAWLDQALAYIKGNYDCLVAGLAAGLPAVRVYPLEGSYLAWLDLRLLKLGPGLHQVLLDQAGLWLEAGSRFGSGGDGFARLNLGCPRASIQTAVERLTAAFG
jgi:cystathionine beta-lyase